MAVNIASLESFAERKISNSFVKSRPVNNPHIKLELNSYLFVFKALNSIKFPNQSGAIWHSILGKALHQLVCIQPKQECESCNYLYQCDYISIFRGQRPKDSEKMRKYQTIPVPHILVASKTDGKFIREGDRFSIGINLVGALYLKLPILIYALKIAGISGLGNKRSQFELIELKQVFPDETEVSLVVKGESFRELIQQEHDAQFKTRKGLSIPKMPDRVNLNFTSPYKPSGQAAKQKSPNIPHFLMGLIRRVSLLQYFYASSELDCDFKQLKQYTQEIPVIKCQLSWRKGARYSAKNKETKDTSGWLGCIELELKEHPQLWPFIYYGQWLNVGKNASLGFGHYVLGNKQ